MRLFLDTNVLASAFGTRGLCLDLLRLVLDEHELLASIPLLDELERVLDEKFEEARRRIVPHAEKAGYLTDEDVFRDIS